MRWPCRASSDAPRRSAAAASVARTQSDEQHASGLARPAVQVQRLVARAAEVASLETPCQCAAELVVEGAEVGWKLAPGGKKNPEKRRVDVGGITVAYGKCQSH